MKIKLYSCLIMISNVLIVHAQSDTVVLLIKSSYMIPMRDGVKLFTVVISPVNYNKPAPFYIERTPYGVDIPLKDSTTFSTNGVPHHISRYAKSGYILVFQDIRGKFKSEGNFEMCRPLYHLTDKKKTDESTDTFDTIEWLLKDVSNNNGKAGIWGASYSGRLVLDACADPHPALKTGSPQASMVDLFQGDDFHHNGAFRLSYAFEYSYFVENMKDENSIYPFPQFDLFTWYLKLGSLKNVNEKYFKNRLPSWNNFAAHPDYDEFWKRQSLLKEIHSAQIPLLQVGGYYDQEDLNGPQTMYTYLEKTDSFQRNFLVLGPWSHGQWIGIKADSLGDIDFESNTNTAFQDLQKKWFDFWLKGIGDGKFMEANCFQTGTNTWKSYESWPPKSVAVKKLYITADHSVVFTKPSAGNGVSVNYISDPMNPVPYRKLPIEETYGKDSHWETWQVADQRFVSSRPDVISFTGDSLTENITVTGNIIAHLFASTTESDADFVVKLIDVYPDIWAKNLSMSGYQLPIAMEVFRGRFRKSLEKPESLIPGKPEEFVIDLHQINHVFLKGHHLMIQIQSSWFPVFDRNPQKYIPNIFMAKETDFIKATHSIYCNSQYSSYIELPVDSTK